MPTKRRKNKGGVRKARFRAALALSGLRQQDWAEREGVTAPHLSVVLNGQRVSARLLARIDAFIAEHLGSGNGVAA